MNTASSTVFPMPPPGASPARPWALLLAAGSGTRLAQAAGQVPKQFLEYRNAPLYWQSALTMSRSACVQGLVFVFPAHCLEAEIDRLRVLDAEHALGLPWHAVAGGPLRQDSVWNGLAALPPQCASVLVHDTARPFATAALVVRLCAALGAAASDAVASEAADSPPLFDATGMPDAATGSTAPLSGHARQPVPCRPLGVIPAVPVADTIKVVEGGLVRHTPLRQSLRAVQTPQAFDLPALRAAHQRARAEGWSVTDDAALLERCGLPVLVVEGEARNIKLTTPEDLRMLHSQPQQTALPCTGFGYDVHRFGTGRPLKLGGVPMPGGLEVKAHSDGDVLLHALMDAILGCAGAGDIGLHFPDTAAAFDNADSAVLLDEVQRIARDAGLRLVHVDLTIITQKPKIAPQRKAIQSNVARLLALEPARINVKATTEEGLGFTGAGEGIKAVAVVTALRTPFTPE